MNIAYVRVSTIEQNPGRQYEDLKKFNIDKWYEEKASAKNTDRPVLNEMLSFARDGDTIYIESFSRLARNTADLLKIIDDLKKKNVKIISQKENLDSDTPIGKMMITMIGAIATFERISIHAPRMGSDSTAKAYSNDRIKRSTLREPHFFYSKNACFSPIVSMCATTSRTKKSENQSFIRIISRLGPYVFHLRLVSVPQIIEPYAVRLLVHQHFQCGTK